MSDYANDESYLSPPGSDRTTGSPCKGAAGVGWTCDFEDYKAWQKRLNQVMEDLKKTRTAIRKEYEASDPGVFTAQEEHQIKQALSLSRDSINSFEMSSYVGKARRINTTNAAAVLLGGIGAFAANKIYTESVEDIIDMIHRAATALDKLNQTADTVKALTPDAYVPYTPDEPLTSSPGVRMFLIGAGVIVGGAMVIGGVRGYRGVTRG